MSDIAGGPGIEIPGDFIFGEVPSTGVTPAVTPAPPSLGPLAAFVGTFRGSGFNTIFRPDSSKSPTALAIAVSGSDNVLELNLTEETLSFSRSLGTVPNRGFGEQADAMLNGVPYLQAITDVTNAAAPVGIHVEPGLWMAVPATTDPAAGATFVRMASIPHGTTIVAQGTSSTIAGKPTVPAVSITPFSSQGGAQNVFPSQTAATNGTARIPQDLQSFITAGTITQAMLSNPNVILANRLATQTVHSTDVITISTDPAAPLFGGGAGNIAFLLGNSTVTSPNAQVLKMEATFWIETVEFEVEVPEFEPGQPALVIPATMGAADQPAPEFLVDAPVAITTPRTITVAATQIQYSQQVFLNFNGLTWPHISVATLVPADPIPVPASAF